MLAPCTRGVDGKPCGRFRRTSRLKAGDCPRCWVHSPHKKTRAARSSVSRPPPRSIVCIHLGPLLSDRTGKPCGRTYECEAGHGAVCPSKECRRCEDYSPDV